MEWFVSMPKVELHAHLNGSIRVSTLLFVTPFLLPSIHHPLIYFFSFFLSFFFPLFVFRRRMQSLNFITIIFIIINNNNNNNVFPPSHRELAKPLSEKGAVKFSEVQHVILKNDLSVAEVFQFFSLIHNLITDHDTVTRITKEVIEDFASDNVVYLELRTTPKRNDSIGMSKRSYVDAVLKGLKSISSVDVDFIPQSEDSKSFSNPLSLPLITNDKCNGNSRKRIIVRLLLSIDRRETTEAAMETVKLALEMRPLGVVGIDLSGNPKVGEWTTYVPALKFAREQGLYVTLHCGEVPNPKEIHNMLDFHPHRIGHACWFEDEHWRKLKSSKIPVEICLTSNIRTSSVRSIDVHHFGCLYKAKHPLVLCTDDTAVFSTRLSKEYKFAADSFRLKRRDMFELSRNAVEYIFADNGVKEDLRNCFNSAAKNVEV